MSHLLLSPSKCPECGATYWGIPDCPECDWIDPDWKAYEEGVKRFWDEHRDEIQVSLSTQEKSE